MRYEKFIRDTFDVVGQSGVEFNAKCPWHPDGGKPNLYINGVKGVYICHACGEKGHLGKLAGISLPGPSLEDVRRGLSELKYSTTEPELVISDAELLLYDSGEPDPEDYWKNRGLTKSTIRTFELGYDHFTDAVTIPIRDIRGRYLGVQKRFLNTGGVHGGPRYQFPSKFKKSDVLFGAHIADRQLGHLDGGRYLVVTEGPVDAMKCWQAGFASVAMFGSALTDAQTELVHLIDPNYVVVFTDNDVAGRKALAQIVSVLCGVMILAVDYTGSKKKDPGEMNTKEIKRRVGMADMWWHMPYEELADIRY